MGFLQPSPPPFDLEEWSAKPYLSRLKLNAQDWAVNGFGAPSVVYLLYAVKLILFSAGAFLLISQTTPGLGGLGDIGDWWTEPIVFQKLAVWILLWEIAGLGSGSMPLAFRFAPPIGGILYWLRPRTVRLPPWPDKVPLTRGSRRMLADVALYAGVLACGVYLLLSAGETVAGSAAGRLDPVAIGVLLGVLGLLGLRDKVSFLAARPEIYGFVLIVSLFGIENLIVGWQLVFLCIWWGAAASKLNRHFPYVIAVMVSNTPWNRSRTAKAKLYMDYPEDLRPSRNAAFAAHLGTAIEFALPLVLLLSSGGALGTLAVIGMIIFHIHITSTFPLGVPLEWNLFMIFGLLFLFGHYGEVPLSTLGDPLLWMVIALIGVLIPIIGNLFPDKVSFLLSMRYYAGNWATSTWLFRKDTQAEDKLDRGMCKVSPIAVEQVTKLYGSETAEYLMAKGLAFRAMHGHGRALTGLLPRAVDEVDDYHVREGELISGVVTGWNFGEGHFHHHQLIEAIQEQCRFGEGDVRVVTLESQPAHIQRQRYRIYDAAAGLLEEGWVDVADMVKRGPWLEESWGFPVEVTRSAGSRSEPAAAS
ncbi:MAG: DUF3556 domain-containing protein [Actinomycetota bacterium]|nr:DUF3556 domain-containing protein [Actinomycetota bacterium]